MDSFRPNRSLLNAKFEGYKLDPIRQEDVVDRYKLSRKPTQATASSKIPLSFQEMRSRISHNHLTVDSTAGRAIYVDENYAVCMIGVPTGKEGESVMQSSPSFRILYEMATPMETSSSVSVQREYPSSAFISPTTIAVTDGNGLLYILPIRESDTSEPIGMFTLRTGSPFDAPFRIHHAHRASATTIVLLLSSRFYPSEDFPSSINKTNPNDRSVEFDIWATKIELLSLRSGSELRELEVLWHRRGNDVPIFTEFIEQVNAFLIIGGSTYPDPNIPPLQKPYEPSADEIAPIPRAGENLDKDASMKQQSKPHPYSWTQTSDSVTVAFPLPSSTPKTKIKVLFTTQTLTLHVNSFPLESSDAPPVPMPHYSAKALWDSVNPSSCFWTWDKEGESSYGLLTLHMEKKNESTRWMQVFASSASSLNGDEENPEVPESLDPSELANIREALEKYTASLKTGEDSSGLGLGRGVPSLAEGEMDEEADSAVGRQAWATWVGVDGQTPAWTREASGDRATREEWEQEPFVLLSTPIPGSVQETKDFHLVIKQDVDGAVYSLLPSDGNPALKWEHTSTYHALSFVLASKRDTRFTYTIPRRGVLAFEGGSARDRGANVYIYRPVEKTKDKWAKQSVLQVDDGSGGALLGVGRINEVLVCLMEGELVLIKGV
ncbi:hypothetical protein CPC08DRAFT_355110 [Agrocybe pediades]|nr:hypothetical protein CPC08DRAFT_355110 [Agrocybe pediades]